MISANDLASRAPRTFLWRRSLVATLVAGSLMQATTALLWMNPLTRRIILTPEFGQRPKLINVWTVWEPLRLIAYQLLLQLGMAVVEGLAIARLVPVPIPSVPVMP